jgi:hypothetical protein
MIIKVEKYGKILSVQEHLNNKHKEHCLCWQNCKHFKPNDIANCPIAQKLYEFDIFNGVTTPVWECVKYENNEKNN